MNADEIQWLGIGLVALELAIMASLVPVILLQRRESAATLAWVLVIVFLPYLGALAYWIFGSTRLQLRRRERRSVETKVASALAQLHEDRGPVPETPEPVALSRLAGALNGAGPQPGNEVHLLHEGPLAFDAMESAIDGAHEHVHLEFYIWEPDRTGQRLRDALVRAAGRGVEVRLLLDDVGSAHTRSGFFSPLERVGGKVVRFLPVNPLSRQLVLNNRNHRKILIADGQIGFTGGMNVGDLYAGLGLPWRDLLVRVRGPAVLTLQEIFCEDWYHAAREDLVSSSYFPDCARQGDAWVQFLASGPADARWRAIHTMLFAAISVAQERVWIGTPYFVPDSAIAMAMQTAALRGVDVRLMLPAHSDHPLVLHAGRSFLDELLAAGVRVYELTPAMLHAKTVTVDGLFATVGSANMDQRSFRLNFEANALIFDAQTTQALDRNFLAAASSAMPVTLETRANLPYHRRLSEGLARVLAPLL